MAAFIFDLDGTLIDSAYPHVLAWQQSLAEAEQWIDGWRIHRRIGMSAGLLLEALSHECGCKFSPNQVDKIEKRHAELFQQFAHTAKPLRGAVELLNRLK